jgi:hypothetical protein
MRLLHLGRARAATPNADLMEWEFEHSQHLGHVWLAAAMGQDWALYEPGTVSYASNHNDPLRNVTPGWVIYNSVGRRRPRLRRERRRLVPWVEAASGGLVVECAEGLGWYGLGYARSRYVVYLRVAYDVARPEYGEVGL